MSDVYCIYHGWYSEYITNKRIATELGITILQIPEVDIVLYSQAFAVIEAEAMAQQVVAPENANSNTVH